MKRKLISRIIAFAMVTVMTFTSTDVFAAVRSTEAKSEIEVDDEDIIIDESEGIEEIDAVGEEDAVLIADDTEEDDTEATDEIEEIMEIDDPEELTVSDNSITADGASYGVANPRRDSSGTVTWDCVYFGSYPQAEVVADKSSYTAIGSDCLNEEDIIEDEDLYAELQSASFNSKNLATVTYSGSTYTYKRIKKENATNIATGRSGYYNWSDSTTWHYFRCEPIKWRVLSVNGSDAFLLADMGLDDQRYNTSDTSITWEKSTIRSWLNGYGSTVNTYGTDYSSNGDSFIDTAFTSSQKAAIKTMRVVNADNTNSGTDGGNDTSDKVFLLSEAEVYSTANGFSSDYSTYDKCRRSKSSTYAKAMGAYCATSDDYRGNCWWWLRSPGDFSNSAASVGYYGSVPHGGYNVSNYFDAVRPALHINLSSNLYTLVGTVNSNGVVDESEVQLNSSSLTIAKNTSKTLTVTAKDETGKTDENPILYWGSSDEDVATVEDGVVTGVAEGEATITVTYKEKSAECEVTVTDGYGLKNPRKDKSGTVIWDCVYFGSYPQAEVVADKSTYTAIGSDCLNEEDIIEDEDLYAELQSATFNSKNLATVTYGEKKYTYKRIKQGDAAHSASGRSDYYNWSDSTTWHYFRCEPIKWRVLSVNGSDAFLLADKGLDDKGYNTSYASITWKTSTIRSWLNGYGSTFNTCGTDYSGNGESFIDTAFTSSEKEAIKTTSVVNSNNSYNGTAGGNDTSDKVFLLSEAEVYSTANGFSSDYSTLDKCRRSMSSTYAKAMGVLWNTPADYRGNCHWWLRSPGDNSRSAAFANYYGSVARGGDRVSGLSNAARPALHINLSSDLWEEADTVNSNGDVGVTEIPDGEQVTDNIECTYNETEDKGIKLTLSGTGRMPDYEEDSAPWSGYDISEVVISDNITYIGDNSFSDLEISRLTLPISAQISEGAFKYSEYDTVELTKGTGRGFDYTESQAGYLPWSNSSDVKIIVDNGIEYVGNYTFSKIGGYNDSSITLPDSLVEVGDYAFSNCYYQASIPSSITKVGDYAFYGCGSTVDADDIVVSNLNLNSVGDSSFASCYLIGDVKLNNVENVPDDAFCMSSVASVEMNGVKSIGKGAFNKCDYLESIRFGSSLKKIGEGAFAQNEILDSIAFKSTGIELEKKAFYNCKGLKTAKLDGVKSVGDEAFLLCKNLETVEMGSSVKTIGKKSFMLCEKIQSIKLPDTLSAISESAFSSCSVLEDVTFGKSITTIGDGAFSGTAISEVKLPSTMEKIGSAFTMCDNLKSVDLGEIKEIGESAFQLCENLEEVKFGPVKTIGNNAFSGWKKLGNLTLPNTVTSIGERAFMPSGSLTDYSRSITIANASCSIGKPNFINTNKAGFTVIKGFSGSTAESIAKEIGCGFVASLGTSVTLGEYSGMLIFDPAGAEDGVYYQYFSFRRKIKLMKPVRPGYTFKGWYYTNNKGKTVKATTITSKLLKSNSTITLTARWSENYYNVKYYVTKPAGVSKMRFQGKPKMAKKIYYTKDLTLPTGVTGTDGSGKVYHLAGWTKTKNGTTVDYAVGETVSGLEGTEKNNRTVKLYGVWE